MSVSRLTFGVLGAMLLSATLAMAQDAVRIGVCNPSKVFEGLDERKAIEERMKADRDKIKVEAGRRQQDIKMMAGERDQLKPGSGLYDDKTNQLMRMTVDFEVWVRITEANLARQEKEQVIALYDKIRKACEEVAVAKKLDLVLAERKPQLPTDQAQMDKLTPDQVRAIISQNDVLYANDKADISADVVATLNKKFNASSGTGVTPPK